jgi:hypothetical protein
VAREIAAEKFEVVQVLQMNPGARTMGHDARSHALYLPTAKMSDLDSSKKSLPKPRSFVVIVGKRDRN